MRLALLAILPWMVAAVGQAQGRPATVVYSHFGSFDREAVRLGDECFVPISLASQWGWSVRVSGDQADILAEGRLLKVPARDHERKTMFPLVQALQQLGAKAEWADSTTLHVRGLIRRVEVLDETIRIDSTMSFAPRLSRTEAAGKLAIDIVGAWLDPKLGLDLPPGITLRQVEPMTARLVIERPGLDGLILPAMTPGRSLDLHLAGVVLRGPAPKPVEIPKPVEVAKPKQEVPDPASSAPRRNPDLDPPPTDGDPPQGEPPPAPGVTVGAPKITGENDRGTTLSLPLVGTLPNRPTAIYRDPRTIEITVPGAAMAPEAALAVRSAFIVDLAAADDGKGQLKLTASLKRPMAFEFGVADGSVVLKLVRPKVEGKLAGKVVVVDPGHGGHDPGAKGGAQSAVVLEKTLNLAISKLIAQELTAQGASVIMTRSDDTFIPLRERPAIANRANADFFISVHINSNTVANKTSGQITFYHMQDPMGILLAECIQSELKKSSGLPSLGTWSDSRIYKNGGFAVLKHATMPAVLLELGFINHDTDRRVMQTANFQRAVAQSVVRGLRNFLGGANAE